jgi:Na+/proline symporter
MDLGLSIADLIVLLCYFLVVIAIGVVASRFVRSREDFVMGGRRFGKFLTIMFTFGAGTNADAAVGVSSQCYKIQSFAGFWYQGVMIFTLPLYWLVSPIFRRARVITTADFFERRFGKSFELLYAVFAMFITVAFSSVGLYGASKLVEALTGGHVSWQAGILVVAAISFFYGTLGGLIATVWNELLQGLLTVLMSVMLIPFFFSRIGGVGGFQNAMAGSPHAFDLVLPEGITAFWIAMMAVNSLLSMVVQPHIMANAGSAKSEMDSRVGFIGGLILKRFMTIPWALTGLMALAIVGAGEIDADHAFGRMSRELLPSGFVGLMLACVLASIMDTSSALLVTFAGTYTNSIHKKLFPKTDERALLLAARCASVAFAAIVIPISYTFSDMPGAMRFLFMTIPPMGIAFFLAVLWPRANRYGAAASFFAAYGTMLYCQYGLGWAGDAGLPKTILSYLILGTLTGIVASLLTSPEEPGRTRRFFLLLRTPIGREQVLLDAGLVEIPGTGSFEEPPAGTPCPTVELGPLKPSRTTVVGFLIVGAIALGLIALVKAVVYWLAISS